MAVERKKFIMTVEVDLDLDDPENVEKVIKWYYDYQIDPSLKIKIKHIRGNRFKVFYNAHENEIIDETTQVMIADPDDDGNYPLEVTIDGVTKYYTVYGEVEGLDY